MASAEAAPESSGPAVGGSAAGVSGGGLLGALGCKRRSAGEEERVALQNYRELLVRGRGISEKQRQWYDKLCFWSDAPTKQGGRIFVLAPRGPRGQTEYSIDIWELLAYSLTKLHDHVVTDAKPFAIVWVQLSNHRLGLLGLRRLRVSLHPNYLSNLEAVHVVHPSWAVRMLRVALWPIAEDDYWERFHSHERVEFLDSHIDTRKFRLPKDIYEYDKYLDKQAMEINDQANKKFGGGGSGLFGGEEDNQAKQQIDQMTKLLEERGHDKAE
mmetsp:Transcript_72418/g.183265  ORF Transcript_72418/g.183265 Transcript_72418/m.183265 type:complete len:270 (-) Transcript_72418:70-879(-)